MSDLMPVPFRNATLFLADIDGVPYAPMKPIVEGMGLDWKAQHRKLTQNPRFASTMVSLTMVAEDGKQREMSCMALRKLPGWMTSINANQVKPEIRDTVLVYQDQCDDALWDRWTKDHPSHHAPPQSFADALQLAADQQRLIEQKNAQIEAQRPAVWSRVFLRRKRIGAWKLSSRSSPTSWRPRSSCCYKTSTPAQVKPGQALSHAA